MIEETRVAIAEFLGIELISYNFIQLDIWSIIHFLSGILVMFLIFKFLKLNIYLKYLLLFLIIGFFEFAESYIYINQQLFNGFVRAENFIDTFWDIIVGLFGGIAYHVIYLVKKW